MRSRALLLREPGIAPTLEDVEVLEPGPGEVMVRMHASGICGTDLHAVTGEQPIPRFPVVLGHEGAGVVESVGPDIVDLARGDHVVVALYADCGECRQCVGGRPDECDSDARRMRFTGLQPDGRSRVRQGSDEIHPMFGVGTLSDFATIRADHAVRIDSDLALDAMCLTACGVATGLGAVVHSARVVEDDSVLVVGCGGVGLNVVQGARIAGASTIIAADVDDEKLTLARAFGATHAINTRHTALDIRHVAPRGVDVAFEVVGNPELVATCLALTRIGGTCVLVGLTPPGAKVPVDGRLLGGARRLVGCRSGGGDPQQNIPTMGRLYRDGELMLEELIGRRVPLENIADLISSVNTGARTVVTMV